MIECHYKLSHVRQCHLLDLARSTYYQPQPASDVDLVLLRKMNEQYLKTPQYGSRSYATLFLRQGILIGRKKAASMMKPAPNHPWRDMPIEPAIDGQCATL
ncbi:hypothetical protein [Nitrosomonas sp.]|uniref:hypothetical protein n=1 Tax=Nitrosomonas sp. TaxID=42353 RepID=UPI0025FE4312|nr:hypothetical protein [Nitrosomonas sp.]